MTNIYQTHKYGFISEGLEPTEETGSGIVVRYSNQGTDTFEYHTPWDYSLNTVENHAVAAKEAIEHWNTIYDNYFGDKDYVQGLLPDGRYAYMQVPVIPKPLEVAPGMVLRNKKTKEKRVARNFTKEYMDDEYEIVCETPHEDDDYSYMCYGYRCRCMK